MLRAEVVGVCEDEFLRIDLFLRLHLDFSRTSRVMLESFCL
jgi:hypothetical protein